MFKFYQKILIQQSKGAQRFVPFAWYNAFSSATAAEAKNINAPSVSVDEEKPSTSTEPKQSNMIKSVFASIKFEDTDKNEYIETPYTDNKLSNAQTVDELLSVSEGSGVSRRHALKVVSILSTWTTSHKINIKDFENDPRFLRLCKILTRGGPGAKSNRALSLPKSEDLSTVLSVTADEEAAKLVETITLSQMIKVLTTLSLKKRRSTLLLRSLAYNIAASSEEMDIKQCADLFYSISSLSFYDENLFEKAANNVIALLQNTKIRKSAVVGSILTSVGLLKYKNPALLDAICEWISSNHQKCRPHDIFSFFMTLGVLNYIPANSDYIFKNLVPQLTQVEAGRANVWLDIVWSLVLLNQANSAHVESVLNDTFINKLEEEKCLNTSAILKLLNIDGAAHYLLDNYAGSKIAANHEIRKTTLMLTKEKGVLLNSVLDTLKNLIPETYFRTKINTGLGFYIDAECFLDKTCNPLPLNDNSKGERMKVAILAYDYHDICKGRASADLTGVNVLAQKLLAAMGYRIVSVPYTDFSPIDKIVNRVQYLESRLKEAVK